MTRRRWVWVGLAAVALVGVFVAWRLTRPSELELIRKHLDAADPGWRFADVQAARLADLPPPDEDVVLTAVVASKLIPKAFTDWQLAADESETWPKRPTNRPPVDPAGEAVWRESAEAITAARRCKDQPRGLANPVIPADPFMTLLPHLHECRGVADVLRVDAVRSAAAGDLTGAAASLRAIQRIAQGVEREPFLVSHLTAQAIHNVAADAVVRCLAVGQLPGDDLAAVEADLRAAADPAGWVSALRDWRGCTDLELNAVAAGQADLRTAVALVGNRPRPAPNLLDRVGYRLTGVAADHAASLADMTALMEIARRPSHEWEAALETVVLPADDDRHLFSRPEAIEARKLFVIRLRRMAGVRTAAVAVACERFRMAHGRWPDALTELPPGDHSDPYTGRPLRLKRLPDGLVVYSVGPDRQDDGGTLTDVTAPPPGTDVGCRLWDAAARR